MAVPEGVATYVSASASTQLGLTMAIAIGLHNIPEGFLVAMPIYFATGSKWKAFFWASLSGMLGIYPDRSALGEQGCPVRLQLTRRQLATDLGILACNKNVASPRRPF